MFWLSNTLKAKNFLSPDLSVMNSLLYIANDMRLSNDQEIPLELTLYCIRRIGIYIFSIYIFSIYIFSMTRSVSNT